MPIPLAPFIAFAVGVFLAWRSRAETNEDDSLRSAPVRAVVLYATLVFAPVVGYFATFATAWSFAYFVDPRLVPSAISLTLVLLSAVAVVGGFVASRRALIRHAPGELAWLAGGPLTLVLVTIVALHGRLGVDATYERFVGHFGREPLFTSRLGVALVWMDSIVAAGAIVTARWLTPNQAPGQTLPLPVRSAPVTPTPPNDDPTRLLGRRKTPR